MTKIREWWLAVGWPWFRTNWWQVLLLPVLAVVATAWFMSKFIKPADVIISDPTSAADERAKTEAELRFKQVAAEKQRLSLELLDLKKKYDDLLVDFDTRLEHRIAELRDDPEKLRQAMLAAGRG